jgi:hypothetical protein
MTIETTAASLEIAPHPANVSERAAPMKGTGPQDGVSVLQQYFLISTVLFRKIVDLCEN